MRRLTVILAMLAFATSAYAQYTVPSSDEPVMLFSGMPRDARAMGMGACSTLASSGAAAAFSNPAAAAFMDEMVSVSLSYGLMQSKLPTAGNDLSVGFAFNHDDKLGFDFGFSMDSYRKKAVASGPDGSYLSAPQPSALMVGGGVSYRPHPMVAFGVNARYLNQGLLGNTLSAFSSDIFVMSEFAGFRLAGGIRNLGSRPGGYHLPTSADIAFGYVFEKGDHALEADAELNAYIFDSQSSVSAGVAYCWNHMLSARFGGSYGGESPFGNFLSAGFGFAYGPVALDLAYLFGGLMDGSLAIALKLKF